MTLTNFARIIKHRKESQNDYLFWKSFQLQCVSKFMGVRAFSNERLDSGVDAVGKNRFHISNLYVGTKSLTWRFYPFSKLLNG